MNHTDPAANLVLATDPFVAFPATEAEKQAALVNRTVNTGTVKTPGHTVEASPAKAAPLAPSGSFGGSAAVKPEVGAMGKTVPAAAPALTEAQALERQYKLDRATDVASDVAGAAGRGIATAGKAVGRGVVKAAPVVGHALAEGGKAVGRAGLTAADAVRENLPGKMPYQSGPRTAKERAAHVEAAQRAGVSPFLANFGGRSGAGLGALAGAALGAVDPGKDEEGNERSAVGGALRGAGKGALIGGIAGYGAKKFYVEPKIAPHLPGARAQVEATRRGAVPGMPGLGQHAEALNAGQTPALKPGTPLGSGAVYGGQDRFGNHIHLNTETGGRQTLNDVQHHAAIQKHWENQQAQATQLAQGQAAEQAAQAEQLRMQNVHHGVKAELGIPGYAATYKFKGEPITSWTVHKKNPDGSLVVSHPDLTGGKPADITAEQARAFFPGKISGAWYEVVYTGQKDQGSPVIKIASIGDFTVDPTCVRPWPQKQAKKTAVKTAKADVTCLFGVALPVAEKKTAAVKPEPVIINAGDTGLMFIPDELAESMKIAATPEPPAPEAKVSDVKVPKLAIRR